MSINEVPKVLSENLNRILLAFILGIASLGVSFIGDLSKNTQAIAVSVQELNIKMGQVTETIRDHEQRIRGLEHTGKEYEYGGRKRVE